MPKNNKLLISLIILGLIFIFRSIIFSSFLSWGDAPFLSPQAAKEFVGEPSVWTYRGNNFGGVNKVLWLAPIMFAYGLLSSALSFPNALALKLLFYLPGIFAGFYFSYLLARKFLNTHSSALLAATFYISNTYFLTIADGGVVGLVAAYGLAPALVLAWINYSDKASHKNFALLLVSMFMQSAYDPRLLVIISSFSLLYVLLLKKNKPRFYIRLSLPLVSYLLLSLYWIIPIFKLPQAYTDLGQGDSFVSLLHGLGLYSPHWPANDFGNISQPPFYFLAFMAIASISAYITKKKNLKIIYALLLLSIFLLKGPSSPLGFVYGFLLSLNKLAIAFRDSTKFFVPAALFTSILLGAFMDKLKSNWVTTALLALIFVPVFLNLPHTNGNLNFPQQDIDVSDFNNYLTKQNEQSRTLWFKQKPNNAFESIENQAVDAENLVNLRIVADQNVGSFDHFNFLNNPNSSQVLAILGIDNLYLYGENRDFSLDEKQLESWKNLRSLVATSSAFAKIPDSNFAYKTTHSMPEIYSTDKIYLLVGSPSEKMLSTPFLSVEDGLFQPENFDGIAPQSAQIIYNNANGEDFIMSFLSSQLSGSQKASKAQWAIRSSGDYLRYKYELLINDFIFKDQDYGKGIAFSTVKGESLQYKFNNIKPGKYFLAIRFATLNNQNLLNVNFKGPGTAYEKNLSSEKQKLTWQTEEFNLEGGDYTLQLTNNTDLSIVNAVTLVTEEQYNKASRHAEVFTEHFGSSSVLPSENFTTREVQVTRTSPSFYNLVFPDAGTHWVIFSDSYNPLWQITRGPISYTSNALYGGLNVIYKRPEWQEAELVFEGQKAFRWGTYFSTLSLLIIVIIFIWTYPGNRHAKKN